METFDAHPDVQVFKFRQIDSVSDIMSDENAVGFQNELEVCRDEGQRLHEVIPGQGGLVSTDPNLTEVFFGGNSREPGGDLLW